MKKYLLVFVGFFTLSLFAQSNKKCQALQDKAYADFQAGMYKDALSSIKKSIKCDPNASTAYAIQAEIYETIKDSANAIKAHKMCIKTDTLYQSSYY